MERGLILFGCVALMMIGSVVADEQDAGEAIDPIALADYISSAGSLPEEVALARAYGVQQEQIGRLLDKLEQAGWSPSEAVQVMRGIHQCAAVRGRTLVLDELIEPGLGENPTVEIVLQSIHRHCSGSDALRPAREPSPVTQERSR